ncbi:MAG: MBL fold metallo-hydrolase [Deltaproteobacteria bacterium]|nr:MBL fold metallo-hydrolase [Deltaproteobacteria bacterium]
MGRLPKGDDEHMLAASPNYKNGRFFNRLAAREVSGFKAMKEWMKGADHTEPNTEVSTVQRRRADFDVFPQSGLRITWLGHSSSLVEIDGTRLLLDPIWSKRSSPVSWSGPKRFYGAPLPLNELPAIDAVLISHDHYDHLDKKTVQALAIRRVRFVVPLGVDARLKGFGVDSASIDVLDWWQRTKINNIYVTATPARHFSGRSLADRDKTLWAGYACTGDTHRVYYTGDTGMFPGFAEVGDRLGPFDATLVEIGAYHQLWADLHLGPEQAVQAVNNAKGGLLIPVHWATFKLAMHSWVEPAERLMIAATDAGVPYVLPWPGEFVEPASPPPVTRWWPSLPWQTAQQHPIVSSGMKQKTIR